jgi:RND family efflux transporter MFP subunit
MKPTSLALFTRGASAAAILAIAAGCQRSSAASGGTAASPPPEIPVVRAEAQAAPDALTFTGRIEAAQRIELRARVTGPLVAVHYREGDIVRAGAPLFEIDPRPYRARRDQIAAEVARAGAALVLAHQELSRAHSLRLNEAISAEELERRTAEAAAATAASQAVQAALAAADLDLEFTVVRAPVEGRVSRALATVGNLVTANTTSLAYLLSVDAMRVRFSIDEGALQRLRDSASAEVGLGVSGDAREYAGRVDYVGTYVDPATGTAEVRAVVQAGDRALLDGMFARVQLLLPAERSHVLVPETAIGAQQGSRYVLVADAENKLAQRPVTLGSRRGPQRVITAGVAPGEKVVVAGLQFLRPGAVIRPLELPVNPVRAQTTAAVR